MQVIVKTTNGEKEFNFKTFSYRIINGTANNAKDTNFSLQIINRTGQDANFEEIAILYDLFKYLKANENNILNISILGNNNKYMFIMQALNLNVTNLSFRDSGGDPNNHMQSFIDITLSEVK